MCSHAEEEFHYTGCKKPAGRPHLYCERFLYHVCKEPPYCENPIPAYNADRIYVVIEVPPRPGKCPVCEVEKWSKK